MSSYGHVATIAAGIAGVTFLGYCIYFDRKRRSDPLFKQKLKERRARVKKNVSKTTSDMNLPDMKDQAAVQAFFLEEVQKGEEFLGQNDFDNCVKHLTNAIAVCGQPQQLLNVFKQTLPPNVFQMLIQNLALLGSVQMQQMVDNMVDVNSLQVQINDLCCSLSAHVNANEYHTNRDGVLIELSKTLSLLKKISWNHDGLVRIQETFKSMRIVMLLKQFLGKDKYSTFLVLKLMEYIFETSPELFIQDISDQNVLNFNHAELDNTILRVVIQKLKLVQHGGKNILLETYLIYIEQPVNRCTQYMRRLMCNRQECNMECCLTVLQCVSKVFKVIKLTFLQKFDISIILLKSYSTAITTFQNLIAQAVGCNFIQATYEEKRHLLWRYFVKSLQNIMAISKSSTNEGLKMLCNGICSELAGLMIQPNQLTNVFIIESSFTGVSTSVLQNTSHILLDECSARKLMIFEMEVLSWNANNTDDTALWLANILSQLYKFPKINRSTVDRVSVLLDVFMEQDNELFKVIGLLQQVYMKISSSSAQLIMNEEVNPFKVFFQLLKQLAFDESILLDWLISKESKFFTCFQDFLQYTKNNFSIFLRTLNQNLMERPGESEMDVDIAMNQLTLTTDENCMSNLVGYSSSEDDEEMNGIYAHQMKTNKDEDHLDKFMSCIIRLNLKLERLNGRGLLPDPVYLIIKELNDIELLYEK